MRIDIVYVKLVGIFLEENCRPSRINEKEDSHHILMEELFLCAYSQGFISPFKEIQKIPKRVDWLPLLKKRALWML